MKKKKKKQGKKLKEEKQKRKKTTLTHTQKDKKKQKRGRSARCPRRTRRGFLLRRGCVNRCLIFVFVFSWNSLGAMEIPIFIVFLEVKIMFLGGVIS